MSETICRNCGLPVIGNRFGSPETGWEHPFSCPPEEFVPPVDKGPKDYRAESFKLGDEYPCPNCKQPTLMGYYLANENGEHMHTRYVCTFWRSGTKPDLSGSMHRARGWSGWTGYGPNKPLDMSKQAVEIS